MLIGMFVHGLYGAILGMGYDIMGSGDEFARLRNYLYYLKKYWFTYFLLGFIVNVIVYLIPFMDFLYEVNKKKK